MEEAPKRRTRGKPNEIDAHVGERVRLRRTLLHLSQEKLAAMIGLTFQQIQKYEKGQNRIGAARLYALAQALDVPVSYFLEDVPVPVRLRPLPEALAARMRGHLEQDTLGTAETRRLVAAYYRINNLNLRLRLLDLAKSLAGNRDTQDNENVAEDEHKSTTEEPPERLRLPQADKKENPTLTRRSKKLRPQSERPRR